MNITVQEFKHCDMIAIKGRIDSATAPQLAQALEAASDGGKYKIVINMSELEYMSSAGFRALLAAQRNCKRYNRRSDIGPARIREALELAGFTEPSRPHDPLCSGTFWFLLSGNIIFFMKELPSNCI
jgi:anti-sigma B factor antagonist